MGRGSRRDALVALGRIAATAPTTSRQDLAIVSAQLGASVADAMRAAAGYTTTEARDRLGVTLPTVHAWLEAGLLPLVRGSKEDRLIERAAIDELAEALNAVRQSGPKKHLLRDVVAWMESKRLTQEHPDLAKRLQKRTGKRVGWRTAAARSWRTATPGRN